MKDPRLMADLQTAAKHILERGDSDCTCAACDAAYLHIEATPQLEDTVDGWTREVRRRNSD